MKDREKQIEEMAKERIEIQDIMKLLGKCSSLNPMYRAEVATVIYGNNYRKLPEDSVVLTREEYERLKNSRNIRVVTKYEEDDYEICIPASDYDEMLKQECKETAEKVLKEINNYLKLYSHIHTYAQEAKKSTEQYADGEPVEMESVWDAITLNKNGYDDYKTMNTLQDNIENIAKSRLLREIERDFWFFVKRYGVEVE